MHEVPRPVPLAELVRMRPDVAGSYTLLCEAIRAEQDARDDWDGTIPADVTRPVVIRAVGWKLFCWQAFLDLLTDQIKAELMTKGETD